MTMSENKVKDSDGGISELKDKMYSAAGGKSGRQADNYTKVTKAVAEYVGRVYGHAMKMLIMKGVEAEFKEPDYPTEANKKAEATWSKKYDWHMKKKEQYEDHKAKVFTLVVGRCDKTMKNRIESDGDYEVAEKNNDVVALLGMIKSVASDSNDRKYPAMQGAMAWKTLCTIYQHDSEDLLDYYNRFVALVEHVESEYGKIVPEEVAKKDPKYKDKKTDAREKARDAVLACVFMDRANKKRFGHMMKKLEQDYALDGDTKYPESVEDALRVLTMYEESNLKRGKQSSGEDVSPKLSFAQRRKVECYECGEEGHIKRNCPKLKSNKSGSANVQVENEKKVTFEQSIRWAG